MFFSVFVSRGFVFWSLFCFFSLRNVPKKNDQQLPLSHFENIFLITCQLGLCRYNYWLLLVHFTLPFVMRINSDSLMETRLLSLSRLSLRQLMNYSRHYCESFVHTKYTSLIKISHSLQTTQKEFWFPPKHVQNNREMLKTGVCSVLLVLNPWFTSLSPSEEQAATAEMITLPFE